MTKSAVLTSTSGDIVQQVGEFPTGTAGLTIETILAKYDGLIRKTIAGRCDYDVFDDRYHDTILNIMKYIDTINAHPNPLAYILTVAKRCAQPNNKANRKMITYGGWTNEDGDDNTEQWLLEDDTHNPEKVLERRGELKQRKRAEDWAVVNSILQRPARQRLVHIKSMDSARFYRITERNAVRKSNAVLDRLLKCTKTTRRDIGYIFKKKYGELYPEYNLYRAHLNNKNLITEYLKLRQLRLKGETK